MSTDLPHRPDLQGLRAVAVLAVMLAHAGVPLFAGGFVDADLNSVVCPQGECSAVSEGVAAFRDNQHLTDSFAWQKTQVIKELFAHVQ